MTRKERQVICPKCGERGSLQLKKSRGLKGVGYYWCVAHYLGMEGKTAKVKWCYVHKYEVQRLEEYLELCLEKIGRLISRLDYLETHYPVYASLNYPRSVQKRLHRMWIRALKEKKKRRK